MLLVILLWGRGKVEAFWSINVHPSLIKTVQPSKQQIPRTKHKVVFNKSTVNGMCSIIGLHEEAALHVSRWWLQLKSSMMKNRLRKEEK